MTATLAQARIRELGRGESNAGTLALLAAGQQTRRLLVLRMLLDCAAAESVGPNVAAVVNEHADLLEAAEHADPVAARKVLFYPLTGPWAERCVRHLAVGSPDDAARDLAHLGSLAAAAAARSGIGFTARTTVHDGWVTLPTLGALRSDAPDGTPVDIMEDAALLVLRAHGERPVRVRRGTDADWLSADPRWLPLHTLPGGPRAVFLDDLDAGRLSRGEPIETGAARRGVRTTLAAEEHERWAALWREALPLLCLGGSDRLAELALLECIIPVNESPEAAGAAADPNGDAPAFSSTLSRAFGAVLTSRPPSPAMFAAGIVHELQHAKLAALTELVPLHSSGPERRYWAPWRPDPRPFDGLLHGVYAHLALAAFWQCLAQCIADAGMRDRAWAAFARCHTQVGAALPSLRDARSLTAAGRVFVAGLAERHRTLGEPSPPRGHAARAVSYVETARMLWLRQYG